MQVCLVYIERVYVSLQRDGNVLIVVTVIIFFISIETDFDPGNEISVFHSFLPSARRPRIWAFRAF